MSTSVPIMQIPQHRRPWNVIFTFGIIVFFIVVIVLLGVFAPTSLRLGVWIGTLILLSLFLLVLGRGITGQWFGFLIDSRNKMSLSRLQIVLWLLLIGSAYLVAALSNLHILMFSTPVNALSITIPPELLALFGVSVASLVGASVILTAKMNRQQQVARHQSPEEASWYDMFKGDDVANADYLDLSKVQMFFITIILVLAYGVALGTKFMGVGDGVNPTTLAITAIPTLSATLVILLGISQAGYLAYKAVPRKEVLSKIDQHIADLEGMQPTLRDDVGESDSSLPNVNLRVQIHENELNQARQLSTGSAITAILGFLVISTGVIAVFTGNITIGSVLSLAGIIVEIGVALSLKQIRKVYERVDETGKNLLKEEQIKQALSIGDEALKKEIISRTLNLPLRNQEFSTTSNPSQVE